MTLAKFIYIICGCSLFAYCAAKKATEENDLISAEKQVAIFQQLMTLTNNEIPDSVRKDAMAFLILPLNNSCPSCRDKTMDSISLHIESLLPNHFIILSANNGIKNMRSIFVENGHQLPMAPGKVFIDSSNIAYIHDLYSSNPSMFYTEDNKVVKKVFSLPESVKQDLSEFFSGTLPKHN